MLLVGLRGGKKFYDKIVFVPLRGEEWNSSTQVIFICITLFGILEDVHFLRL